MKIAREWAMPNHKTFSIKPRVTEVGGEVLSFGWNSVGMGKSRGFEIVEIMLVSHGGMHNDTIYVREVKK